MTIQELAEADLVYITGYVEPLLAQALLMRSADVGNLLPLRDPPGPDGRTARDAVMTAFTATRSGPTEASIKEAQADIRDLLPYVKAAAWGTDPAAKPLSYAELAARAALGPLGYQVAREAVLGKPGDLAVTAGAAIRDLAGLETKAETGRDQANVDEGKAIASRFRWNVGIAAAVVVAVVGLVVYVKIRS
jgi:hypothetical protein